MKYTDLMRQYTRKLLLVCSVFAFAVISCGCRFDVKATNGGLTVCVTWAKKEIIGDHKHDKAPEETVQVPDDEVGNEELNDIINDTLKKDNTGYNNEP